MDILDGRIIKVDRVASLEEALLFARAGANMIGASLAADPRLADERFVTAEVARAIGGAIGWEHLAGIVPDSWEAPTVYDLLDPVLDLEPGLLQVHLRDVDGDLADHLREEMEAVNVVVDGLAMGEDYAAFTTPDDPARFVREQFARAALLSPVLAMVDLKGEGSDVWRFLTETALLAPGESLQMAHVQAATREMPLLLDLSGVQPRDARAYVGAFPDAKGFYARLGPERGGCTSIRPERLLPVLKALRD